MTERGPRKGGLDEEYGIVVGSIDMQVLKTQLTQERMTDRNAFYEPAHYGRALAPGAYVYYAFY